MTKPDLQVVPAKPESHGQRVRRLQAEARSLAKEHVGELLSLLGDLCHTASEIAEGGDAYPPGIREEARRMADETEHRVGTIRALSERSL